jgi:hypothetical protein
MIQVVNDSSLLVELQDVKRADTGELITSGVSVTADLYRSGESTPLASVVLSHDTQGNWRGVMDARNLVAGSRVDIRWVVDGGPSLRRVWWERNVVVLE